MNHAVTHRNFPGRLAKLKKLKSFLHLKGQDFYVWSERDVWLGLNRVACCDTPKKNTRGEKDPTSGI